MNINQYTDRIIKLLKKTPVDHHHTIWEMFINDKKIKEGNFAKVHIELINTVFMADIEKMKQEEILDLWRHTENCYIHGTSLPFMAEPPEYEGDIIQDIKNEMIELILCDISV